MQRTATKIFIYTSVVFGLTGVAMVFNMPGNDEHSSPTHIFLMKVLLVCVFIVLSSFALSIAGKYLKDKK